MGCRIRVYFGSATPLRTTDQHLELPKSDKLFFISPPPSPPHGWEMRNEDPPNKQVHAEDLANALSRLHASRQIDDSIPSSPDRMKEDTELEDGDSLRLKGRRRGSSTIVYHPEDHGDSLALPAIAVEDTSSIEITTDASVVEGVGKSKILHTARPPVELMH
jgi:hypothetical protein